MRQDHWQEGQDHWPGRQDHCSEGHDHWLPVEVSLEVDMAHFSTVRIIGLEGQDHWKRASGSLARVSGSLAKASGSLVECQDHWPPVVGLSVKSSSTKGRQCVCREDPGTSQGKVSRAAGEREERW